MESKNGIVVPAEIRLHYAAEKEAQKVLNAIREVVGHKVRIKDHVCKVSEINNVCNYAMVQVVAIMEFPIPLSSCNYCLYLNEEKND
jgi:hypothetical protein